MYIYVTIKQSSNTIPTADQRQTSPFNLWPAMCGTVWRNWQVISCLE